MFSGARTMLLRFDLFGRNANDFRNGVDDQPNHARPAADDDDSGFACVRGGGDEATAAEIDDGRDASAKVRDAFDPWLRARDGGDALHAHDLLDRLDVEAIVLTRKTENDDVFFGIASSGADRGIMVSFERVLRPGHRRTPVILPCKSRLLGVHKA